MPMTPDLQALAVRISGEYPEDLRVAALEDVPRTVFHVRLALEGRDPRSMTLCDVGGGGVAFSAVCAALGMKTLLVDDFRDPGSLRRSGSELAVHRSYGVQVVECDVTCTPLPLEPGAVDVFTSVDSIEHWHSSPKPVFQQMMRALKPGGLFVLGTPNCVNLRKRLTVPLGHGKWSSMEQWYEMPVFRSHVREPDVADLRYIANDLGLVDVRVLGRNWMGLNHPRAWMRPLTRIADPLLQLLPSLCSDIYMVGRRPA